MRRAGPADSYSSDQFPVSADAAQFLMDARYTRGFIVGTPARFDFNRTLSRQIALHGNYVVEESTPLAALPETGSLVIVAPEKTGTPPRVQCAFWLWCQLQFRAHEFRCHDKSALKRLTSGVQLLRRPRHSKELFSLGLAPASFQVSAAFKPKWLVLDVSNASIIVFSPKVSVDSPCRLQSLCSPLLTFHPMANSLYSVHGLGIGPVFSMGSSGPRDRSRPWGLWQATNRGRRRSDIRTDVGHIHASPCDKSCRPSSLA